MRVTTIVYIIAWQYLCKLFKNSLDACKGNEITKLKQAAHGGWGGVNVNNGSCEVSQTGKETVAGIMKHLQNYFKVELMKQV